MQKKSVHLTLVGICLVVLAWSGFHPHDQFTWFLEVLPILIALPILILTYKRFQFTTFTYVFMLVHACILMVGGHYTYAQVPLFDWIRDVLHLSRNHYDRVGHFAQGFIPALIVRELFIRKNVVPSKRWLAVIVVCVCMTISASYELFEWGTAEATGTAADAFLGTQGDVWDTQWDMFLALLGALSAIIALSKLQDKMLNEYILQT